MQRRAEIRASADQVGLGNRTDDRLVGGPVAHPALQFLATEAVTT
ncbi:hypothetical protein ACWDFL_36460 [Streptomyces bungoensis]